MRTTPPAVNNSSQVKKQYEPPRLDCYGDVAAITRTAGNNGNPDGGHGSHGRTG